MIIKTSTIVIAFCVEWLLLLSMPLGKKRSPVTDRNRRQPSKDGRPM
jgi:hypothetical protein